MLNENYHGEIYHFTSLIQATWIIEDDCIEPRTASCEQFGLHRQDNRKYANENLPCISFTRDKNYQIQGNDATTVCFVFDADIIQNLRNARLYPFALNYQTNIRNESEERLYGVSIYPLHKYVKRIDINLSNKEFSWASDRQYDEEDEIYDEFSEKYPDLTETELSNKISQYLIQKITSNNLFGNKIHIKNTDNSIFETYIRQLAKNILNEYLDKNVMMPLRKYINRYSKRYKNLDIEDQWYKYQMGKRKFNSKHAFSKQKLFKNDWVIHFTNSPLSIIKNGFLGIDKDDKDGLWRTYGRMRPRGYDDGYAFAYDVNDIITNKAITYGNYALMFRTSGLKVFNRAGDEEWQVIFNNNQANLKECFVLALDKKNDGYTNDIGEYEYNYKLNSVSVINPYTRKTIYKADSLEKAIEWVKTNGRQYKSANSFNSIKKLKSQETERRKMALQAVEYIKNNVKGQVLVLPEQKFNNFVEIKVLYTYGIKFNVFVNVFNLKREGNGTYKNDYFVIHKDYWNLSDKSYWEENNLEVPEDSDDCYRIRIYYYIDYK